MKLLLLTLPAFLLVLSASAQTSDTIKHTTDTVIFTKAEHMPEFPGGIKQFYRFLAKTVRYPAKAREDNTQGKVIIDMVVEKDGSLTHFKVVHSVSAELDNEALRVMRLSPKWTPGTQNGHVVRVYYDVPLSFTLSIGN